MNVTFGDANENDLEALNQLIKLSKGYWGYEEKFLTEFMALFNLTDSYLTKNTVKIMRVDSHIAGLCGFRSQVDKTLELVDF